MDYQYFKYKDITILSKIKVFFSKKEKHKIGNLIVKGVELRPGLFIITSTKIE